jgi:hypothetical protein
MNISEIVKVIVSETHLKEDDYFDTSVFYYLSGRFPGLTISQCTNIVNCLRKENRINIILLPPPVR